MNRDKMSTKLFGQNKVLCFFRLARCQREGAALSKEELPVLVHHYHYPCIYYEQLFKFFKSQLAEKATKDHIRILMDGKQLPSNYPIGLYLRPNGQGVCELQLRTVEEPVDEAFKIVFRAWKQAYNILNPGKGVEYLMKRMQLVEQKAVFEQYVRGEPTKLPEERQVIALRGFFEGRIIERKYKQDEGTVLDLLYELWPGLFLQRGNFRPEYKTARVSTHGVSISTDTPTRDLYELFPYNDGYWYLSLHI